MMPLVLDIGTGATMAGDTGYTGDGDVPVNVQIGLSCGRSLILHPVPMTVSPWDSSTLEAAFLGSKVHSLSISREQCDQIHDLMRAASTDAVTDGQFNYTIIGSQLAYCYPTRVQARARSEEAFLSLLASELQAHFDSIEGEVRAHQSLLNKQKERFEAMNWVGSAALEQVQAVHDPKRVARAFLNDLVSPSGRALLGIPAKVEINQHAYEAHALKVFEIPDRPDWMSNMTTPQLRKLREKGLLNPRPPATPAFSVRVAIEWLTERYAGKAGERAKFRQAADVLVKELGLNHKSFAQRGAVVELEIAVWTDSYSPNRLSAASVQRLASALASLPVVYEETQQEVPSALATLHHHSIDKNTTLECGPDIKLRIHAKVAKLQLSRSFADSLREFVTEYATPQKPD